MINFIDILPKTTKAIKQLVDDFKKYDKKPSFMCNQALNLNYIMSEYGLADICQARALREVVTDKILDESIRQCR